MNMFETSGRQVSDHHRQMARSLIKMIQDGELEAVTVTINTGVSREVLKIAINGDFTDSQISDNSVMLGSNYYYQITESRKKGEEVDYLFGQLYAILRKMDRDNGSSLISEVETQEFVLNPHDTFAKLFEYIFANELFDKDIVDYYEADLERILRQLSELEDKDRSLTDEFFVGARQKEEELRYSK